MVDKLKLIVQDKNQTVIQPLASLDFSSFQSIWEKNNSYQITFTAFDDESMAFGLLAVQNRIYFGGELYIIKQLTDSYSNSVHTVNVTASHVFYELDSIRQNDVKSGDVSLSVDDAIHFMLDNNTKYSYQIHGNFGSRTMTDFGNCSVIEGLSSIRESFGMYCIFPSNYVIHFYSESEWIKKTQKAFLYRNNSSEAILDYDSTNLVNRVQIVSTAEAKQFDPFYVTNDESIQKWGIRDGERVENDKDNNTGPDVASAKAKLNPEPDISLTVTTLEDEIQPGEQWNLVVPNHFQTLVQVVSITKNPFMKGTTQVSLNNTRQNFLDAFNAKSREITNIKNTSSTALPSRTNMWTIGTVTEAGNG